MLGELQGRLRAHRVILVRSEIKIMLVLPPLVLMGGAVKNPWVAPAAHGFSWLGTRPSQICWVGYPRPKPPGSPGVYLDSCPTLRYLKIHHFLDTEHVNSIDL